MQVLILHMFKSVGPLTLPAEISAQYRIPKESGLITSNDGV